MCIDFGKTTVTQKINTSKHISHQRTHALTQEQAQSVNWIDNEHIIHEVYKRANKCFSILDAIVHNSVRRIFCSKDYQWIKFTNSVQGGGIRIHIQTHTFSLLLLQNILGVYTLYKHNGVIYLFCEWKKELTVTAMAGAAAAAATVKHKQTIKIIADNGVCHFKICSVYCASSIPFLCCRQCKFDNMWKVIQIM